MITDHIIQVHILECWTVVIKRWFGSVLSENKLYVFSIIQNLPSI